MPITEQLTVIAGLLDYSFLDMKEKIESSIHLGGTSIDVHSTAERIVSEAVNEVRGNHNRTLKTKEKGEKSGSPAPHRPQVSWRHDASSLKLGVISIHAREKPRTYKGTTRGR